MLRSRSPAALLPFLLILMHSAPARADSDTCAFYKRYFPSLANSVCSGYRSISKSAGASSTFAAQFNLNPASAPTEPSPYGLELIGSTIRYGHDEWSPTFAIIKGFKKFGTGVSTGGNNTFYGNDIVRRVNGGPELKTFQSPEEPKGTLPNLNLGTSFALNPDQKDTWRALKLGVSLRYNHITDTFGPGAGITMGSGALIYGVGVSRELISSYLPPISFASVMIGSKVAAFDLEYTVLKNYGGPLLPPIHIGTVTLNVGRALLTFAVRRTSYDSVGPINETHFGFQFNASRYISLGYLYNYVPGANSVAAQFFL